MSIDSGGPYTKFHDWNMKTFWSTTRGDAQGLYGRAVAQARTPGFYVACGVPDTVAGRFDMVSLHTYVVLRRLKELGSASADLAQSVFDAMFVDMDRNLREMGVGDLAVGHRIKDLAKSFYGRVKAYDEAIAAEDGAVEAALRRNAYAESAPTEDQVTALARYLRAAIAGSRGWSADMLAQARVEFPPAPRID
jgi:cytochrome b pre-mRNA-processing protein 3